MLLKKSIFLPPPHLTTSHLVNICLGTPSPIVTPQKVTNSKPKKSRNKRWYPYIMIPYFLKCTYSTYKIYYLGWQLNENVNKMVLLRLVSPLRCNFSINIFWKSAITLWLGPPLFMSLFVIFLANIPPPIGEWHTFWIVPYMKLRRPKEVEIRISNQAGYFVLIKLNSWREGSRALT